MIINIDLQCMLYIVHVQYKCILCKQIDMHVDNSIGNKLLNNMHPHTWPQSKSSENMMHSEIEAKMALKMRVIHLNNPTNPTLTQLLL